MKLFLQTLYWVLLTVSGLIFVRIMLFLANVGPEYTAANSVYLFTDVVVFPVGMLTIGKQEPSLLMGRHLGFVEPHAVLALFIALIAAFLVSMALGEKEKVSQKTTRK